MLDFLTDFAAQHPYVAGFVGTITFATALQHILKPSSRTRRLAPTKERVLIIGATSGVGRKLANLYAKRGAKVCVVGRRQAQLDEVKAECIQSGASVNMNPAILAKAADMTSPENMVAVREFLEQGRFSVYEQ